MKKGFIRLAYNCLFLNVCCLICSHDWASTRESLSPTRGANNKGGDLSAHQLRLSVIIVIRFLESIKSKLATGKNLLCSLTL